MQQTASSRLGFSPSRTMRAAQKLYEAGLITYMRTDSTNLGEGARGQMLAFIHKKFGEEYAAGRVYATKVKNAQEAHEAIRPTNISKESVAGAEDGRALYRLIWQRALASQMADAKMLRTKITATVGSETPDFVANGSRLLFPGWLAVDKEASGENIELPKVSKNEKLKLLNLADTEKQTEPPPRYSEAGLIKELEKRGIGRPSTYASIMETLVEREYVTRENRSLKPTDTGMVVSGFLEKHFPSYISDTFTAEMEDELDDIAVGKRQYEKTLKDFYTPFHKEVKSKEKLDKATTLGDVPKEFTCPLCGRPLVWKLGRGGKFMSCARFPDCSGALTAEGHEIKPDEPIGKHPETGEDIYLLNGRFGYYVQIGKPEKNGKKTPKPRRASVPRGFDLSRLTVMDAVKFLSLPRVLGTHPETQKEVAANIGRFGPYVVHDGNFRSVKAPDDVYTIALPRALELLAQEKKPRGFRKKKALQ
jgi:DNA topoisomerase-1